MRLHSRIAFLFGIFAFVSAAGLIASINNPGSEDQGLASAGRSLFDGSARLQNGGPPCITCHSISGLPFPNGGSLGPDLTGASALLGPEGMGLALQTLFFPTMNPIFADRLLTLLEQNQLKAFLEQAGKGAPPNDITPLVAALATGGFLILLGLAGGIWRNRLAYVRKAIVHGHGSEGGHAS